MSGSRPYRFLCLHGYRQDGRALRQKMGSVRQKFSKTAEFGKFYIKFHFYSSYLQTTLMPLILQKLEMNHKLPRNSPGMPRLKMGSSVLIQHLRKLTGSKNPLKPWINTVKSMVLMMLYLGLVKEELWHIYISLIVRRMGRNLSRESSFLLAFHRRSKNTRILWLSNTM